MAGVPCHPEVGRDPGNRHAVDHHRLHRQRDRVPRELAPRRRGRLETVTPDLAARPTPVSRRHDLQDRRMPPERNMRHAPNYSVMPATKVAANRTRRRCRCRDARQHREARFDPLSHHAKTETVQSAELIEAWWGSVSHKSPWVGSGDVRHLHPCNPRAPSHHLTRRHREPVTHPHL